MPDTRNDPRHAGPRGAPPQRSQFRAVEQVNLRDYVPRDYPYPKYLTDDGYTRVDLVQSEAEQIARCFKEARVSRSQLYAFYDHAKRQLHRLDYGTPFAEIHPEIARLKAFAADRAGRTNNPLPQCFKSFVDQNVNAVKDEISFRKGFMPHFEAVVAYCANLRER
jgi:CRISPR/Cas system CSM-associated protein Csm2 small subunit